MEKRLNHISEVWKYLCQFKTKEELEKAFETLPYKKWGSFDITNLSTYEQDGFFEICNSYWDENLGEYQYDYHCVIDNLLI